MTSGGGSLYTLMSTYLHLQWICKLLCPYPLPFIEEKGETFNQTQTQTCIKWLLRCALICYADCTRTMTQCMSLHASDQHFQNNNEGWGNVSPSGGMENFAGGNLINMVVGT